MHVPSVEFLHQHQDDSAGQGEDERGDVGVGEVFANVNEGLRERASQAPILSSHTALPLGARPRRHAAGDTQRQNTALGVDTILSPTTLSQSGVSGVKAKVLHFIILFMCVCACVGVCHMCAGACGGEREGWIL